MSTRDGYSIEKRNADASAVFSTAEGERLLVYLHGLHVNRLSYVKGDSHESARREGNKEVILDLYRWISTHRKQASAPGPETG